MIIVKGFTVSFDLVGGEQIDAPAKSAMMHDPMGKYWKKTSVLVMPFQRGSGGEVDGDKYTDDYLGKSHGVRAGSVALPPKLLSEWEYEGIVDKIFYRRHGKKRPGKYQHANNSAWLMRLFKGVGKARLYSRGSVFRLELPRGAIVDGRGYVWP